MLFGLLQVHNGQVGAVDPDPDAPPLPGGAAEIVRFFMDVPQWIQIGGVVVGAVTAVVAVVLGWKHRKRIVAWVRGLPAVVKATAIAVVVAGGTVASVAGYQVYDFVEHDNRFCTGCHVMAEAYVRFEESAHSTLGCKDCHAQPRTESARQLYLWVLERPQEVGPHAPTPNARCTSCHIDDDPEDEWPQIAASMGHRIHFESDDPELGELMCVTCHGVSVHEFTPVDATCGECHEAEAEIRLGRMAAETELHCVACHDFLGEEPAVLEGVPEGIALLPERTQCVSCHEMDAIMAAGELDQDPHGAVCGACHNPHTQDTPYDAVETCMGCHEDVETLTIYHTGTHAPVMPNCTECHDAHSWRVQGDQCLDCHETIMEDIPGDLSWERGRSTTSPRPASHPTRTNPDPYHGAGDLDLEYGGPPASGSAASGGSPSARLAVHGGGASASAPAPASTDTLPRPLLHRQHQTISCAECHCTAEEHGVVTVRTPEQCAACHHDPQRGYECQDCHAEVERHVLRDVAATMDLTVWDEPRTRELPFEHELHEEFQCQECHTGPVMLAVEQECAACHDDHHRPQADCVRCHVPTEPDVHGLEVHLTCTSSGCHAGTAGERPTLTRTVCLTCHQDQRDHEPGLQCQSCHMVPDEPPVRGVPRGAPEMETSLRRGPAPVSSIRKLS